MKPVFTLRKLKTMTPSLKPRTALYNQANVIYEYECASCHEAYIGYTTRHLCVRVGEHAKKSSAIWRHHQSCNGTFDKNRFKCLYKKIKAESFWKLWKHYFIITRNQRSMIKMSLEAVNCG